MFVDLPKKIYNNYLIQVFKKCPKFFKPVQMWILSSSSVFSFFFFFISIIHLPFQKYQNHVLHYPDKGFSSIPFPLYYRQ